jgi:cytochrome b561
LLAIAISHQLFVSLIMQVPRPTGIAANSAFIFHQYGGLFSLAVVLLFWLWTLIRHQETSLASLLPWFSRANRSLVLEDFKHHIATLKTGKLPPAGSSTPLASAVHGLGLLAVSGAALTGGLIYLLMGAHGSLSSSGKFVLEVHSLIATFVWAYLVVHGLVALGHQYFDKPILTDMFSLRRRK